MASETASTRDSRSGQVPQVSDAGISGTKPYTGNYPSVALDALRRPLGRNGLSLEELGTCVGFFYDGFWHDDQEPEVLDAVKHLENLDLVMWTGKVWILKKVRL